MIALKIILVIVAMVVSLYLGFEAGKDYVIDEILKEISIRKTMQEDKIILKVVVARLQEIKKGIK